MHLSGTSNAGTVAHHIICSDSDRNQCLRGPLVTTHTVPPDTKPRVSEKGSSNRPRCTCGCVAHPVFSAGTCHPPYEPWANEL